jgi:ribosome-associated translation inhibitor RaiA
MLHPRGAAPLQVQIAGKKIEIGAALQERIAFGLESRVSKYFN